MYFKKIMWIILSFMLAVTSCKKDDDHNDQEQIVKSDFSTGKDGWTAGFAEYDADQEESYELYEDLNSLPAPLDENRQAYLLSGMNRSDDLFMYLKRQVSGLKPNTQYQIDFNIQLASDARSGGVGAGGAPGEAVGVGVGATPTEPIATTNDDNFLQMNIDKINQCCTDGKDMVVIGNVANGGDSYTYKLIEREGTYMATSDATGNLWLIVGTDSGYEGKTTLYYTLIEARLIQK